MKTKSALIVLIALNCALLSVMLLQFPTAKAENVPDVLRARTIELVDESGKVVRAQLLVESTGEVVFRLRDAHGTIRVKLAAGEDGSGLLLLDDRTEPAVHALVKPEGTTLRLLEKDGKETVLRP
jgi:hypothetical protein